MKKEYLIDDEIILDKEYSYVITNSSDDKIYGKTNILQESLNITNNTSYDQYKLKYTKMWILLNFVYTKM